MEVSLSDFSARHYRMISRRLAESKEDFSRMKESGDSAEVSDAINLGLSGVYKVERKLIELFEADNPKFDKQKFQAASEGKE